MEGLAGQVGGLTTQVAGLEGELREGMQALGETHAQGMRRLEQRLVQGESRSGGGTGLPRPAPVAGAASRRRYPDLVTAVNPDDDEDVFGDAWLLVQEWRDLWDGHPAQGKGLAWVSKRERILELEVAMLEEHGLTLPPETEPLRGLDRGAQLNWRLKALHEFSKRRARLELLAKVAGALTLARLRRATLDRAAVGPAAVAAVGRRHRSRAVPVGCWIPAGYLPVSCGAFAINVGGSSPKPLPGVFRRPDTDFVVWLFQCFHCLETWGRDPCSPGPAP